MKVTIVSFILNETGYTSRCLWVQTPMMLDVSFYSSCRGSWKGTRMAKCKLVHSEPSNIILVTLKDRQYTGIWVTSRLWNYVL